MKIFLYSAFSVSLFGNGSLLVLLVHKTGKKLGNYRFLLATFAITDIFISTFHMWYIPVMSSEIRTIYFFLISDVRSRRIRFCLLWVRLLVRQKHNCNKLEHYLLFHLLFTFFVDWSALYLSISFAEEVLQGFLYVF